MNYISNNIQLTMTKHLHTTGKYLHGFIAIAMILCSSACTNTKQLIANPEIDPVLQQAVFDTPQDAANTFAQAVKSNDQDLFNKLLGEDFREILPLDDVTVEDLENFDVDWEKDHSLLPQGDKKMLIAIGESQWTMPIPIVAGTAGWHFDVEEGVERMRIRRIGRNELATMQAVLAYYDAQMEYSEQDRDDNGALEYAQKFISTPGSHNGLYWAVEPDGTPSPLGKLFADQSPGGGYHGYYYRILKAQGKDARGGAYSYLIGNKMRAGFALIAWPVEYGESGIMSFIVSHSGIVYEQNLGSDSAKIAKEMQTYNPGTDWVPDKEVNSPPSSTEK